MIRLKRKSRGGAPADQPQDWPSRAVVQEELSRLRQSVMDRNAALDNKAGVILGFAGVLIALVRSEPDVYDILAQLLAIVAVGLSVWTLLPQAGRETDPRAFGNRYLKKPEAEARKALLDTSVGPYETDEDMLGRKALRFRGAVIALSAAGVMVFVGTLAEWVN